MAQPAAVHLGVGDDGLDQPAEDGAEDRQGEPSAGLTEGAGGKGAAGPQGDGGQGGVAVEELDEEPVEDGRRSQEAGIAPGMAGGGAGGVDDVSAEPRGEVLPEGLEGSRNSVMHHGASCARVGLVWKKPWCTEALFFSRVEAAWL